MADQDEPEVTESAAPSGGKLYKVTLRATWGYTAKLDIKVRSNLLAWLKLHFPNRPPWIDDALGFMQPVEFFGALAVPVASFAGAIIANQAWLSWLSFWLFVLFVIAYYAHLHSKYQLEIKHDARGANDIKLIAAIPGSLCAVFIAYIIVSQLWFTFGPAARIQVQGGSASSGSSTSNAGLHGDLKAIVRRSLAASPTVSTAPVTPVPATHFTFTQELLGQKTQGYPFVLRIVLQTDHKIEPLFLVVVFKKGAVLDKTSVLGFGAANGPTMALYPRSWYGTNGGEPFIMMRCECTPAFSPETPFVVTVQSTTNLSVDQVIEPTN